MKCACPMGGDRTCPDDCPLAVWATLSSADRKAQRKPIAERLYRQGFTMEQIATQLGLNHGTISRDLREFVHDAQIKKPAKTASNPKGAGRPKGKRQVKRRTGPTPEVEQKMGEAVLDERKTLEQVTTDFGLPSVQHSKLAVAKEEGRREMLNQLLDAAAAASFSDKGKLKIEDAIRIHKARLDKQFGQRVNEEVHRRIDSANDATREQNKQLRLENINLQRVVGQRGVFTKTQFRQMQMLCHPDNSASPQLRAELSQILVENEVKIVKPEALPSRRAG